MEIPGLGSVTEHPDIDGWLRSEKIPVKVLGGKACRFIVEGYVEDPCKEEFHAAIQNFLALDPSALTDAQEHVFAYFKDRQNDLWQPDDPEYLVIASPADVWKHVRLGSEPMVSRRHYGDQGIYISLECGCDWEEEHGLQIVFKNGQRVNKVGPYDGHLTNSDAYEEEELEDVVYRQL